jgi:streptogramin lyase
MMQPRTATVRSDQNRNFESNQQHAMENKTMNLFRLGKLGTRFQTVATSAAALGMSVLLSGCGLGVAGNTVAVGGSGTIVPAIHFNGSVHGGQQPVTGATIQLYTVGTTGLQSASTPLISSTVTTSDGTGTGGNAGNGFNQGAPGNFTITGDYSCTSATQVYIVATGGNSGAGTNSAIALVSALGPCTSLTPTTFIQINEVTTIAAAYALAPFATDFAHIGASGSNPAGLLGAFANAALLANYATGSSPGAGIASGVTIPVAEINTLANIVAACINTSSTAPGNCSTLQAATSSAETFGASLGMAKNPGSPAVVGLYNSIVVAAPFQPYLSSAPNDFTVSVTTSAAGSLATPYGVAIDASGDAWVTNETGTAVTEISPAGSALANPTIAGLAGAQGIAVDRSGNVWVANTAGNSVVKFTLSGGSVTGANSFTNGGISGPLAIALDSANNAFVANYDGNSVTGLTQTGASMANSPFTGSSNITLPQSVSLDASGNVYATSGNGSVVKLTNAGNYVASYSDGTLQGPSAVTIDGSSHILATGFTTGTTLGGALAEFSSTGVAATVSPVTASLSTPSSVASDGTSIWVTNGVPAGCLAQYVYGVSTSTSPSTGLGSLSTPTSIAIDATGSIWTTNSGSNTVSKFIGLAAPVTTPKAFTAGP